MSSELTKAQIKGFLFDHIKKQISSDIKPLLSEPNTNGVPGGYFAVPLLVLTLVEYLGRLRYGCRKKRGGSECAVRWIKEYLGFPDTRYEKIGGLLYDMFRHGIVHSGEPEKYLFSLKKGFAWEIVKNERQQEHLTINKGMYLTLSLNQLVDDLEKGVELFWQDLKGSVKLRQTFSNAYWKMRKVRWVPYLISKKGKKHYLKSDFEYIKERVRNLT